LTETTGAIISGVRVATPQDLSGNTLRTYLHVLKHGPSELREIQLGLGFSSPSLASYHLNKLAEIGYVAQDRAGSYVASKDVLGDVVDGYSKLGTVIIPQLSFFAILFSIIIPFFAIEAVYSPSFTSYLTVVSMAVVVVLWYETFRLWRKLG
jgi:hypothetical protein